MDWVEETIYIYKTYCFFVLSVFSSVYLSGRGFPGGSLDSLRGVASVRVTAPAKSWEETAEQFGARLKQAADYVNARYDVEGLQRELPARLGRLCDREGARIGK